MSITEIKKLSVGERLEVMEQIWESLRDEDQELSSPSWHEPILEERKRKMESGEATFMTLDQLKARFHQ